MRHEIEFRPATEAPKSLKPSDFRAALILNPCDGYHHCFAWWSEGEFVGFTDFLRQEVYEPGRFFIAWAVLPDEVTLIEDMRAVERLSDSPL